MEDLKQKAIDEIQKYDPDKLNLGLDLYHVLAIRREEWLASDKSEPEKFRASLDYLTTYSKLVSDVIYSFQLGYIMYDKIVETIYQDRWHLWEAAEVSGFDWNHLYHVLGFGELSKLIVDIYIGDLDYKEVQPLANFDKSVLDNLLRSLGYNDFPEEN